MNVAERIWPGPASGTVPKPGGVNKCARARSAVASSSMPPQGVPYVMSAGLSQVTVGVALQR